MAGGPAPAFAPPTAPPLTGLAMAMGAFALALSNFVVVLDITIANVSVPHISGSLAVSPSQGTWVITSYAVAEAICVPLTGWLAARFGAVRVFILALMGFGLFSVLCGLSRSLEALIAFRVMQGLCGAPMMPMSQTLLLRVFPPQRAAAAMGLWAMTTVCAPIAGPILGGLISDNLSWHWIFFINVPIVILCATAASRLLTRYETPTVKRPIDYVGLALLVVWVGALQIMLDKGREEDWFSSTMICTLAIVAVIGFVAFLIWELTERNPIVDLSVFRHRGFTVALITQCLAYGAFFSIVVLTPLFLQTNLDYTATVAGQAMGFMGVLAVVMSPIVAQMTNKVDVRGLISFGVMWLAIMAVLRSDWVTDMGFFDIALPQFLQGFGMPFYFVGTTTLALGSVLPQETASAAGLSNFARTLSGAFATSLSTTMWDHETKYSHAELVSRFHPPADMLQQGLFGRVMLDNMVQTEAVTLATNTVFLGCAGIFIFAACFVWLAPKPKPRVAPGAPAKAKDASDIDLELAAAH
ncbi:DHA2 family efflux MFS transporter permease subunit [Novosphingobium sp. FSW06-99]|uniref:DHA2 family efflux MFS transporter permease subunit n=1 Tax=Novosphingobium sp. FSW06-99 TaxID=1739113 RepID=UPI00076CAB54|nr:DHA2 family efflux MFS transporter permease subunit [Novosphingobium sp. FSW06-99]KUR78168.1 multidrug resistance protein B [Novosphingobium sp. FSW06-99]